MLSTAFHTQTDRQTERMNAGMDQYLRIFTNHQQDNWVQCLPIAEFAANNRTSESTKCSLFVPVTGTNPQMTFIGSAQESLDHREINADQVQAEIQQIHKHLRMEMQRS
jgi:hypothetical protein